MPTPTYTPIATTTVSSGSYAEFTSIPSTYTDLVIVWTGTSSNNTGYGIRFNGDSGSNYSLTYLYGDGSTPVSGRDSNTTSINGMGRTGTSVGIGRVNVMNYANTTTYKTAIGRGDLSSQLVIATVGLWRSTAAINAIRLTPEAGNITSATFTLYGIKAA